MCVGLSVRMGVGVRVDVLTYLRAWELGVVLGVVELT